MSAASTAFESLIHRAAYSPSSPQPDAYMDYCARCGKFAAQKFTGVWLGRQLYTCQRCGHQHMEPHR